MLFFLVSFLSLLLITKPLSLRLPSWVDEMRLLFVLLFQELLFHSFQSLQNYKMVTTQILKFPFTMFTNKNGELRIENVEKEEDEEVEMRVLDLPELALDLILEKLSPVGLLNLANVCSSLRERCRSDHLWERHFREKWGRVIGNSARKEWERYSTLKIESKRTGSLRSERPNWWPFKSIKESGVEGKNCESNDSVMAWYMELESGRFWFPAQVYNRENGHAGFMLSCYDAELSYDSRNDTFHARYPPLGQRVTNCEEGVSWERLRVSPVDTPAHDLHVSNCLKDLHPGDHIEIQWRRNKEYPYGWWYGMVGHESCDGDELHCRCNNSDTVILEFNQYSPGSIWRKAVIDRKYHREEGNETDGFYGGIRKIYDKNEISMWRRLWPTEVLE